MLELDGLHKRFGDVVALDDLSFRVGDGELVGFLGPNGAGKTTTMRAVVGLLKVDRGSVRWNGHAIDVATRRRFGYMPEERGLYPRMRVLDEVVYFARLAGLSTRDAAASARRWLDQLGLRDRYGDEVSALSHGNQQRVQLAVALAHEPELLVLDEPFSGLDPIAAETMQALLVERAQSGAAVLFSSHQLDMVEDLCRNVVIVHQGRVVVAGTVDELRAAEPTRYLEVAYATPPVADGHLSLDVPGARLLGEEDGHWRFEVPASLDLDGVLQQARHHGELVQFSFEPPDLSVVFRNAVGNGAASAAAGPAPSPRASAIPEPARP